MEGTFIQIQTHIDMFAYATCRHSGGWSDMLGFRFSILCKSSRCLPRTRRLNLHMNRIQDLGGLSHFRALEDQLRQVGSTMDSRTVKMKCYEGLTWIYNAVQEWMSYECVMNLLTYIKLYHILLLYIYVFCLFFFVISLFFLRVLWTLGGDLVYRNFWLENSTRSPIVTWNFTVLHPQLQTPFLWCYVVDVVATRIDNEWWSVPSGPFVCSDYQKKPSSTMLYFSMLFVRSWSSRGTASAKWGNMAYSQTCQNCQNLHHLHPFSP